MSYFLRLVGVTNAALWFGAVVTSLVAAGVTFTSAEVRELLPEPYSVAMSLAFGRQILRFEYGFAAVAMIHLGVTWLYLGPVSKRWTLYFVTGLLGLVLFEGLTVGPRLKRLHREIYGVRSTPQQRELGNRAFRLWREVELVSQTVLVVGLWVYLWEVSNQSNTARFVGAGKIQGLTKAVT